MFKLRDYQQKGLSDLYEYLCNNPGKHPVVSASVGAGKSIMIAKFCETMIKSFPHLRILNLVHTKELISQNYDKFKSLRTNISSSVYSASLKKKSLDGQVVYGGIQSIARNTQKIHWDLILVDEVHLISKQASKGMYRQYIDFCKETNPNLTVIGFTGTAFRLDGGSIVEGDEKLFDEICVDISIRQLLDLGFLSPLVLPANGVKNKFDTSNVKTSGNDFNLGALAEVMDDRVLIDRAVDEYMILAKDRKHHLIFGSSIDHCYHLKESFSRYIKCEVVHGGLKSKERDRIINSFLEKELNMVINMTVLSTGFDAPHIDSIGLLRATESPALYIQIAGRGLRLAEGKIDCLWVDFTDTTERLGPIDDVIAPPTKAKGEKGEAPVKSCWACEQPVAAMLSECPHCGALFEMNNTAAHGVEASTADILKTYREPEWFNVTDMRIMRHTKRSNGNKMIKATYYSGLQSFDEYTGHEYQIRNGQFSKWWGDRNGMCPAPGNIDQIIDRMGELLAPERILIDSNGKHPQIKGFDFKAGSGNIC